MITSRRLEKVEPSRCYGRIPRLLSEDNAASTSVRTVASAL
jgi:hypothetical protein